MVTTGGGVATADGCAAYDKAGPRTTMYALVEGLLRRRRRVVAVAD
jgi:hypothetical protein